MTDSQQLYRRVYADTHLLLLAGLLAVLVVAPGLMPRMLGEDSWVEIPTALLAVVAAVLAVLAATRSRPGRARARCIAFGAVFLFVVGEENDWGIRLFMRRNMVSVGEGRSAREVNLNTIHELHDVAGPGGSDRAATGGRRRRRSAQRHREAVAAGPPNMGPRATPGAGGLPAHRAGPVA
ncbi:MAG: hypothetical protein ACYSUF_10095 [Planctomycetota bacterium]